MKRQIRTYLMHSIVWLAFICLPVLLSDNAGRLFNYLPLHYLITVFSLIPIFYLYKAKLTPALLLQNKILQFIGSIIVINVLYLFFPILICEILPGDEFSKSYFDLHPASQAKIRFGTLLYFAIVLGTSVLTNLIEVQQTKQQLEHEKTKAELDLLKSQINPHFLFNSLNSIYYLALRKDPHTPEAIITISDLMRYVLTEATDEYVRISKEIAYLEKYIQMQSLRLSEETKIDQHFEVHDPDIEIAPMLLISIIENAFKYGISTHKPARIDIQLRSDSKQLRLEVSNDIVQHSENQQNTQLGLKNLQKRLTHLYPDQHHYTAQITKDNRYQVNLTIDLNRN